MRPRPRCAGRSAAHASAPVDFVAGVRAAHAAGARVFVQAVAGTTLLAMARATLRADGSAVAATVPLAGPGADDGAPLIEAMAELAVLGVPVALRALHGDDAALVSLPATPLPTERYWCATRKDAAAGPRVALAAPAATSAAASGESGSDDVVALFRQQMEVLQAHAQIMQRQAEALAGRGVAPSAAVPMASVAPVAPVAAMAHVAPMDAVTPAAVAPAARAELAPATAPAAPAQRDDISTRVLDIVAQVSAFPRGDLRPTQRLVADLGFDSLMVVELAGKASDVFPGLKGLPKALFAGETTIADVIAHVRGAVRDEPPADAGAAAPTVFARYVARAVDAPLAALPGDAVPPFAGRITVLPDRRGVAEALAGRLKTAGIAVDMSPRITGDAGPRGIIDLRPLDAPPGTELAELAELRAPVIDAFAAARALAGARPSLFAVAHGVSHGAALAGFAKALAREWSDARVKAIAVDVARPAAELAEVLFAELVAGDATVEVSYASRRREVIELARADSAESPALAAGSVVAITGGARGLGAKLALELARRARAKLVLLGRSPSDPGIAAHVAAIEAAGGAAIYVACDVRDAAAVAAALDAGRHKFGPIEIVVHAAGVIADAAVATKDPEAFGAVFDTKAGGWLALERATRQDPVRVALALTSWSGRFGNAEQTDYAAANALVASLAAAWHRARPTTRAVALDLPPWDGSAMAATIPAGLRSVLRARGVRMLDDASGLAAVMAELAARDAGGEVLLGHDVAAEREAHLRVRIDLATHPYLGDHQIDGSPVLPLAAAADYVAIAGGCIVRGPLAVTNLELIDGVRLGDGPVELDIRARLRADGSADVELAPTATPTRLAYRARVARSPGPLAALASPATLEPAPLPLAEFYARHTFHGPRLHGIVAVDGVDATHVAGTVRAARTGELGDRLGSFAIDPLMVDAAFQLAAYFMLVRHRRAGLPLGFDELRLLAPIAEGARVACIVALEAREGDVFAGHIDFRDGAGQLVAQLRGVRGAFRSVGQPAIATATEPAAPAPAEIPAASYMIESFPEYLALRARIDEVETSGIDNPYFNVHQRITADTALIAGRELINFSTYNYLGLSGDPAVSRAAMDAISRFGTSVSASRIASGEKPLHRELELALASFLGCEDAIAMVGGHATNVSVIGHIVGPGDLVMHDSLAHDSILAGSSCRVRSAGRSRTTTGARSTIRFARSAAASAAC